MYAQSKLTSGIITYKEDKCISEKTPAVIRNRGIKDKLRNSFINSNRTWVDTSKIKVSDRSFTCIDLFAGAGGISCGFEQAGIKSALAIEIEDVACQTYRRNIPDATVLCKDITQVSTSEIKNVLGNKKINLITGGFPCQGFSLAGFRDPDDKRNILYKEVVRVVKDLKPDYVVLENVPGVTTMKKGEVYKTILKDFASIGYPNMSLEILDAAEYGAAQLRPRAIFIANRCGLENPYPKQLLVPEKFAPIESAIDDLKNKPRDPSTNHEWTKHSKEFEKRISKVKPGDSLYASFFDAYKRQYRGVPSMTIKENHGGTHIHYELNRVISAREMARLQGFPDEFYFEGGMKKAMWQIGNAVSPILFKHIGLALRENLEKAEKFNE